MGAVINVVLPVFAIILAGFIAGKRGWLGAHGSASLNGFVFYVSLPALLFISMTRVEPAKIFNWNFIGVYTISLVATFVIAATLVALVVQKRSLSERVLNGMSAVYGNTGYMGIPLVMIAFGPAATVPAVIATVVNAALIFGFVCSVVEVDQSVASGPMAVAKDVSVGLITNPLFIAPIAGVAASMLGLTMPSPVQAFCDILGAAAGPCALFALGLFMVGKNLANDLREAGLMVVAKLVIQPLIAWVLVTYLFPMDPLWAASVVIMAALPTGTGAFVVAQRFGVYVDQTSSATLLSTLFSVITLSVLFSYYADLAVL